MFESMPSPAITIPVGLLIGYLTAKFAQKKERNARIWFFLGFLFGAFAPLALYFLPSLKEDQEAAKPPIIPVEPPHPFTYLDWYYLDKEHQQIGPISFQAFTDAHASGHIHDKTFIWNNDLPDWIQIESSQKIKEKLDANKS